MTRVSRRIGLLGVVVLFGLPVLAQSPAEAPLTNLQVFPETTTRAQLIRTMNAFNESLGVQCSYCHVTDGPGGRPDFASDEKPTKDIARRMVGFRDNINEERPAVLGKTDGTRVLCSTCHRGVPIPRQIYQIVFDATANGGGPAAGLARFRELRSEFYGGQSYDFSEGALIEMARRSAAERADDAMAYLQGNLEYYPESARTYRALAQAKNALGDRAGAIRDLERAAQLDPDNAQISAELQQLKGA